MFGSRFLDLAKIDIPGWYWGSVLLNDPVAHCSAVLRVFPVSSWFRVYSEVPVIISKFQKAERRQGKTVARSHTGCILRKFLEAAP